MGFRDLINLPQLKVENQDEEARFSFLQGRYVEDFENQGSLCLLWYTGSERMKGNSRILLKNID